MMRRTTVVLILLALLSPSWSGETYDDGYWTPTTSTTVWWTPTTSSSWSYWTPTTTYVTIYTQQGVIVTVTSILPCPVTSTVVYWECCDQCETNCAQHSTSIPTLYYGTTTVTSYTTTTPWPVQTITSNGVVVVVMDTTPYSAATASVQYEIISDGQENAPSLWPFGVCLAVIATVMLAL